MNEKLLFLGSLFTEKLHISEGGGCDYLFSIEDVANFYTGESGVDIWWNSKSVYETLEDVMGHLVPILKVHYKE